MAKKIYIGEILGEVMSKVEALQVDMQSVANQMLDVAKNTSYLENLYLAVDRRSNVTYSSGDSTLAARLTANLHLFSPNKTVTAGSGVTPTYAGGYLKLLKTTSGSSTSNIVIADVTDYEKCFFKAKLITPVDAGTNTFSAEIDGVVIPGSDLSSTTAAPAETDWIEIDTSDITALAIDCIINAGSFYTPAADTRVFVVFQSADGHRYNLFPNGSAAVVGNKITLAADNIAACFTLAPVTGISIAQWDCLTWIMSNNNEYLKVEILDNAGNLLVSDIKRAEALGNDIPVDFYLRVFMQEDDSNIPALEAVSYLYLT